MSLSSLKASLLFSSCALNLDMFLTSRTLAAAIGTLFVKRERSRIAPAERIIGGLKRDMGSEESSCKGLEDPLGIHHKHVPPWLHNAEVRIC